MWSKKLPETDEERINVLRTIAAQEEINESPNKILSVFELGELNAFTKTLEGSLFIFKQAITDINKAKNNYNDLFKNAQMYISHFIQVLLLTVIRNEIKAENLILYGFTEKNPAIPDLSTEEAIIQWGENLIRGEADRISRSGIPLYNPAIAKVKVHYELFKESIYSLTIYEKSLTRIQNTMNDIRNKADTLINEMWTKTEERYRSAPPEEQTQQYKAYKIQFHRKGEQLNVFD